MNTVNSPNGVEGYSPLASDAIVVEEENPIIRLAVIGSACTPPGYVQVECEPIEGWRRPTEIESVMPVRMRIDGLWGTHLRVDQWFAKTGQASSFRAEVARLLDTGVTGIQLPRAESHEQVVTLLDYVKYPPLGSRAGAPGYGGSDYHFPDAITGMSTACFTIWIPASRLPCGAIVGGKISEPDS